MASLLFTSECSPTARRAVGNEPLNFIFDNVYHFLRQTGDILVAQVDRDPGLLQLGRGSPLSASSNFISRSLDGFAR
jgi:hypothetical protein